MPYIDAPDWWHAQIQVGAQACAHKHDESPVSLFLLLHAFVFFCHFCYLSSSIECTEFFVCLFVCGVPSSVVLQNWLPGMFGE